MTMTVKESRRGTRAGDFFHVPLSPGFNVYVYPTDRFKTSHLGLFLHRTIDREATRVSMLESVLQRGCKGYPSMRAISTFLESLYGASFDTDVLKIGERQLLSFSMRLLNDRFAPKKIRSLEQALDFMSRVATEPLREGKTLRKDFVDQEKLNLERFLRGIMNDRMGYAMLRCTQIMCEREPYGIYEYGALEDLPGIEPRGLTEFYDRLLAGAPIDLFVAGAYDAAEVVKKIERPFRRLIERPSILAPQPPRPAPPSKPRQVVEHLEVEQAKLILGFRTGLTLPDPEFPAFAFFNGVLGAYPHSRLFADLREKQGLCYQAHSFVEASKGLMFVVLGIDAKKFEQARDSVLRHVQELQAGRITDEEFNKTRELIIHAVRGREDSPRSKIFTTLEGSINGRIWSTEQVLAKVRDVKKDELPAAGRRLALDTVYLLTNP